MYRTTLYEVLKRTRASISILIIYSVILAINLIVKKFRKEKKINKNTCNDSKKKQQPKAKKERLKRHYIDK